MTVTMTRPAPAAADESTAQPPTGVACIAAVSPSGRLRLPATPTNASALAMNRRTGTGRIYRIDLAAGISCWLDGDQHDGNGELNPVATGMCYALSGGSFVGPNDAPFVCGLVLFTGAAAAGPVALSEQQLRRIVDAHAASADELSGQDVALFAEVPVLA